MSTVSMLIKARIWLSKNARGATMLVVALSWGASPAVAAQYTLRVSSWGSPTAPQVSVFVPTFKKLVEQGSKGRIAVQTFSAGTLIKEQDVPSAIESRVADVSLSTIGAWASISAPAALINSILFRPTQQNFEKVVGAGSGLFKSLDASLRKHNVVLLAVLDNGPPMVVSHVKLMKPADFRGMSIRVYDKATAEIIHTLGAAPSTMPVSAVYEALQRGTVQAAIGGIQGITGLREYEVAKYLLDGNGAWGVGVTIYVMNGTSLKNLPPDLQQVVVRAGAKAEMTANKAIFTFFGNARAKLRRKGMQLSILQPNTQAYGAFVKALSPLAKAQEAKLPANLLKVLAASDK